MSHSTGSVSQCLYKWADENLLNPLGAEAGICQENQGNTMVADALAPCVARSSAAMVLDYAA